MYSQPIHQHMYGPMILLPYGYTPLVMSRVQTIMQQCLVTMHFLTKDLVNWTDHGRVLYVDDVEWAIGYAWAGDAVYWEGKYYLVYCMKEKEQSWFETGLAVSDVPQRPV